MAMDSAVELETLPLAKERRRQRDKRNARCQGALAGGASRAHQCAKLASDLEEDAVTLPDGLLSASIFQQIRKTCAALE
eukprot:6510524-Pyramimonas_sp.AAC.1